MNIRSIAAARTDVNNAIIYYNEQETMLGAEFEIALKQTIERMSKYPEGCPVYLERVRRCQMRRFPYGVFYILEPKSAVIIAVLHNHREPYVWKKRIKQ